MNIQCSPENDTMLARSIRFYWRMYFQQYKKNAKAIYQAWKASFYVPYSRAAVKSFDASRKARLNR